MSAMSEFNPDQIPLREVLLKDSPTCEPYYRKVSKESVRDTLMDADGEPLEQFEELENSIYFYVSDEEFDTLSNSELAELVARETEAFVGTEEEV